jgi:hypothetical protein
MLTQPEECCQRFMNICKAKNSRIRELEAALGAACCVQCGASPWKVAR